MSYIKIKSTIGFEDINIFYQDYGVGKPVIFIHGWPLNSEMWEYQLSELPNHDIRCIAYDRRGFGKSDRPWEKYDYDTLAGDLNELIIQLNLSAVTLIGFSMGGGEVARYIGRFGTEKIEKVVFISSVTPFRLQTFNNPDGTAKETFDTTIANIKTDRPALFAAFGKKFYGVNPQNEPVSEALLEWNQSLCLNSSPKACTDAVRSFSETDFRNDLKKINIPALIIHGDADLIVPIQASGDKTATLLPHAIYKVYAGSPHGLFITDKEKLNIDLIEFITE